MTPSQKAHTTRYFKAARAIVEKIENLPESPDIHREVIRAFEAVQSEQKVSSAVLADAFWVLDTEPGRFAHYHNGHWFSRLRRVRNTPEFGRRLFALWS